jgi:hypothetical protein
LRKAKAKEKVVTALQKVDRTTTENLEAAHRQSTMSDALQLLGAIRATQTLGRSISAQSFRALMKFRDEGGHVALGFERFDDFLNNFPTSPMSKHQFYDRLKAIESEGDDLFDLLNTLRIPIQTRKEIGEGQIRMDGETLILGTGDRAVEVPMGDRRAVADVIRNLTEKTTKQAKQLAEQAEKIKSGEKENKTLKKSADYVMALRSHPFDQALMNLIGSFAALSLEAEKLSPAELEEKRDNALLQIATQRIHFERACGLVGPRFTEA